MKNKILSVLTILACALCALQCGDGDVEQNAINGTWKIIEMDSGEGLEVSPFNDTTSSGVDYTYNVYISFSNILRRQYNEILTSTDTSSVPLGIFYLTDYDDNISKVDSEFIYCTDGSYMRYILDSNTLRLEKPSDNSKYMYMIKVDDSIVAGAIKANSPKKSISRAVFQDHQ